MRKYGILLGLVGVLLAGCSKTNVCNDSVETAITAKPSVTGVEMQEESATPMATAEAVQKEEQICPVIQEDTIAFYNANNKEIVYTYKDAQGYVPTKVISSEENFVAIFEQWENTEQNEDTSILVQHGSDELGKKAIVFDKDYQVVKEDNLEAVPEMDRLFLTGIDSDGENIVWGGNEYLCSYNLNSKEFNEVYRTEDFIIEKLVILDQDKYAFYGWVMGEDNNLAYGIIENGKANYQTIKDYHAENILSSGKSACIIDGIDPMVGQNTSGQVLLIDGEKGKIEPVEVDTFESMSSIILDEGKYLVSFLKMDEGYRVRQYCIDTMKVMREIEIGAKGKMIELYSAKDEKGCYALIQEEENEYTFEFVSCVEE